jgi:hypothetical protein
MSTSEQEQKQQQNIICVEYEDDDHQYEESTNQSEIYLQNQPKVKVPVSCRGWNDTYTAYHIFERSVVIDITATDTLVKIEHHLPSKPLHVHISEHLCGHTIFVIFNDHILRMHLENSIFIHLEDRKLGSLFKECKTDFSFRISEPESSSFRIIEDERNESLRACLVLDEITWKKVELFEINLFSDECIFAKYKNIFIRLPPNITGIEIHLEDGYIILSLTGKSTEFPIYIYDEKTDALDDYHASPIFLLNECERCILSTSDHDQLERFQQIGFNIVVTMYVCPFEEDHGDLPEIQAFIKDLLELNKYHRSQWDSDCGSDSD